MKVLHICSRYDIICFETKSRLVSTAEILYDIFCDS